MSILLDITSHHDLSTHQARLPPSALLVVYFYTPWTAFCTQMTADMTTLASQYLATTTTPPAISFVGVDGKKFVDIAKEYGVRKAPCVICVRNGEVLESIGGSDVTNVRKALERHTGITARPPASVPVSTQDKEALIARLTDLVQAAPVMLFMKGTPEAPRCRFGRHLVGILREQSIDFETFDILGDEKVRQGMKEFADWPTFPQLWVNGELIGGLDIVREEIDANPGFLGQYSVSQAVA